MLQESQMREARKSLAVTLWPVPICVHDHLVYGKPE